MPPLLRCLLLAATLGYALAYTSGGFEEGGSTLVSAMMVSHRPSATDSYLPRDASRCFSVTRTASTSWTRQKRTLHRSMAILRGAHYGKALFLLLQGR